VFPYLENLEHIADSKSQPLPPPLPQTETYPSAGATLSNDFAEPFEREAYGCLETKLQHNPWYPFATREKYKYIQREITKKRMKTYNDQVAKQEATAPCFPSFNNGDGIQKIVVNMQDDLALEDIIWNECH
jgi:hypothetical protein